MKNWRWIVVLVVACALIFPSLRGRDGATVIPYSQFVQAIDEDKVANGEFDRDSFRGRYTQGQGQFVVNLDSHDPNRFHDLEQKLLDHGVQFEYRRPAMDDNQTAIIVSVLLPLFVMILLWSFFTKQRRVSGIGSMMASSPIVLTLPDSLAQFVNEQVLSGKFTSPDDYIREVLREAQRNADGRN